VTEFLRIAERTNADGNGTSAEVTVECCRGTRQRPTHEDGEDDDDDEDDVDDEDAGDDDDDTPTLELGEEGRPRRNKPTLSHDAAVSARPGAGRTNNAENRPEIAFTSLS
jgi:hypothetical protein